jgi:L-threonylcarbamoyladenylate synthase|tara:strand:- start:117 stop:1049 length:933 start_codon:yes stop_codon:yes gene_type:complete
MNNNLANIKKSISFLNKDDCVAIPTETVYGLAANAYSSKAVRKIYTLKRRPINNPSIIHYSSLNQLEKDCELNKNFFKLYKKFCPGPITFVLKLKKESRISKIATNNKKTVAIRFPKNKITQKLLKILNYPLAAPSANISTKISPVSASDVREEFGNKIKFILNGGRSKIGLESTIISLVDKPKILRLGGIERTKINKVLNKKIKYDKTNKKISVPGQSKLHYSPGIPIKLNITKPKPNEAFILIKKRKKSYKNYYYLTKNKNLKQAAKNLYRILRVIKKKNYERIVVEKIPNNGFGETINDRLKRASTK